MNNYTRYNPSIGSGFNGIEAVAVYTGLLAPPANTSESIAGHCPTGNCTFPHDSGVTFSTLEICHSYRDISDLISDADVREGNSTSKALRAVPQRDGERDDDQPIHRGLDHLAQRRDTGDGRRAGQQLR